MFKMSQYMYTAAFLTLAVATLFYLWYALATRRVAVTRLVTAGGRLGQTVVSGEMGTAGKYGTMFAALTVVFLTLCLAFRAVATGHGPFANMYEFTLAFAWGVMVSYVYFEWRYKVRILGVFASLVAVGMMAYAAIVPAEIQPLVPALQNNLLLTIHVAVAIVAYGTFAIAFVAALLYLFQGEDGVSWMPTRALLDEIGYKAVIIGFPMMALVIILGALWADVAWGSYWSWDPKETASLVTWLIYGGYLHARTMRGWRGTRSAVLLLLGFAATLFTYFGNLFFGGLHSYGGLG
ncbi:MAG: c-type cytochrome biogenesis protein CcsB [Chloroflexota bacterium]|nr:MAG: c-type cytochrome biogenesis protein CcsB [Chloroflexota bacterium]